MFIISTENSASTFSSFSKALEHVNQVLFFESRKVSANLMTIAQNIGRATYDKVDLVIERV